MSVIEALCAVCGDTWCDHSDLEFAGIIPARKSPSDRRAVSERTRRADPPADATGALEGVQSASHATTANTGAGHDHV